jgi:hypothetical protein
VDVSVYVSVDLDGRHYPTHHYHHHHHHHRRCNYCFSREVYGFIYCLPAFFLIFSSNSHFIFQSSSCRWWLCKPENERNNKKTKIAYNYFADSLHPNVKSEKCIIYIVRAIVELTLGEHLIFYWGRNYHKNFFSSSSSKPRKSAFLCGAQWIRTKFNICSSVSLHFMIYFLANITFFSLLETKNAEK